MAQGSKPRHSKPTRKPVTIDLPPEDVSDETTGKSDAEAKAKTEKAPTDPAGKTPAAAERASTDRASRPADSPAGSPDPVTKPSTGEGQGGSSPKSAAPTAEPPKSETGKAGSGKPGDAKPSSGSVPKSGQAGTKSAGSEKPQQKASRPTADAAMSTGAPAPQHTSGSAGRTFGVGIAAAVVAVVLFGGLQYAGVLPVPGGGSGSSATDVIASDIAALKQSVASLEHNATDNTSGAMQDLETRIAALESSAETGIGDAGDRLAALESKVDSLAGSASQGQPVADTGALQALSERVAALEKAQSEGQAPLQAVDSKLTSLEQSVTDQQASARGIQGTLTALDQKVADEAKAREDAIKAIDGRLAEIEKSLSAPRQDMRVARALAAANLKAAIDRGGPFMAELEAYASVDGDSPVIAPLRSLAAAGVSTRAALMARFSSVANAMIDAGRGDGSTGNVFGRLMDSASSLVTVRPVGEVSGDSVEAIVARMENRLKNGDLQGAVNEWNTLPQAARDASTAYVSDLKARIEADSLISSSLNAALPAAVQSGEAN